MWTQEHVHTAPSQGLRSQSAVGTTRPAPGPLTPEGKKKHLVWAEIPKDKNQLLAIPFLEIYPQEVIQEGQKAHGKTFILSQLVLMASN